MLYVDQHSRKAGEKKKSDELQAALPMATYVVPTEVKQADQYVNKARYFPFCRRLQLTTVDRKIDLLAHAPVSLIVPFPHLYLPSSLSALGGFSGAGRGACLPSSIIRGFSCRAIPVFRRRSQCLGRQRGLNTLRHKVLRIPRNGSAP